MSIQVISPETDVAKTTEVSPDQTVVSNPSVSKKVSAQVASTQAPVKATAAAALAKKEEEESARQAQIAEAADQAAETVAQEQVAESGETVEATRTIATVAEEIDASADSLASALTDAPMMFAQAGAAAAGGAAGGISTAAIVAGVAVVGVAAAASSSSSSTPAASPITSPSPAAETVGQSFTLTTGTDISGVLVGSASTTSTDNANTFIATNLTYTSGDIIAGGSGNDTLTITATAAVTAASSVTSIETINVNSSGIFAASFDAANIVLSGTALNIANSVSTGSFTVTNLGTGATIGASGVSGALAITTTASTAQAVTLGANSAASQSLTLTGTAGTDTATVSAAGTVALNTAGTAQIETVNLSGNGAAVTYTISGTPTTTNITGSQSVTLSADEASFDGKTITDTSTGTAISTLKITTSDTSDLSKAAVDLIEIAHAATDDVYTVRDGQSIKISTAGTGFTKFDLNDQTTTVATGSITVELGVALLAAAGDGLQLDATAASDNITKMTIVNNTVAQATEVLATTNADLVITGSKNFTLEATSTAKSVDASGLTGVLAVTYDNTSDIATVTGGSGADTFTNLTTAIGTSVTINGGAGNDTFTMLSGAVAVIDGGAGTGDKLVLAGTNNASSLTLSNIEVISLTGTGAATFKASQLTGKSFVVTGDTGVADKIVVGGAANLIDSATVDLSSLVLDTTNVTNTEITFGDGAGATYQSSAFGLGAAFVVTGTAVIDTVVLTDFSGADTISVGAGNDVVNAGGGNDTITAGEGADVITGGLGADTIILTETTAAIDTVILTTGGAIGVDSIIGFNVATAANNGDNVDISLSDINRLVTDLSLAGNLATASNVAANTDPVIAQVAVGAYDMATVATAHILNFVGNYTATTLARAMEVGGTSALTTNSTGAEFAAGDAFLVLYDDGTDSYLAYVVSAAGAANDVTFVANDLTVTNIVRFVGIADSATFVSNNFDIIA